MDWLEKTGAVGNLDHCRRVIIEASYDSVVTIYIELLADTAMLECEPPDLSGARVVIGDKLQVPDVD